MDKDNKTQKVISALMKDAHHSILYEDYENVVLKLQRCVQLEDRPMRKAVLFDDFG